MTARRETFLPFSLPTIGEEEISEVAAALRSGWVTTGPRVKRFEGEFAEYVGARHAVAVASATAGLHLSLAALDVGPEDEVIVPTMTFCSTANVVLHLGARPVLVDVGDDSNVGAEAVAGPHGTQPAIFPFTSRPACEMDDLRASATTTSSDPVGAAQVGAIRGRRIGLSWIRGLQLLATRTGHC